MNRRESIWSLLLSCVGIGVAKPAKAWSYDTESPKIYSNGMSDEDVRRNGSFRPRSDQPERLDQQTSCLYSRHKGITLILGGNGSGKTTIAIRKVAHLIASNPVMKDTLFYIVGEDSGDAFHQWTSHPQSSLAFDGVDMTGWKLKFVSYKDFKGGLSIGGFLFMGQPPVSVWQEAYRCTREYGFVGNKIIEFTPIDTDLCDEWNRHGYNLGRKDGIPCIPSWWGLYHLSTECAVETGHVSREWFDLFRETISQDYPSQLQSRMHGAWPEAV